MSEEWVDCCMNNALEEAKQNGAVNAVLRLWSRFDSVAETFRSVATKRGWTVIDEEYGLRLEKKVV